MSWAPVIAASLTAGASLVIAILSVVFARNAVTRTRRFDVTDRAQRYREPLLHAAYNLQSRLWNIAHQRFLEDFHASGNERERQYARLNTTYLIGQYFCWAELIRDEAQYLSPGRRRKERKLISAMEGVRHLFADSQRLSIPTLRIFRGDQRAIGELFLVPVAHVPELAGRRTIGYAAFVNAHSVDARLESWLAPLIVSIDALAADLDGNGDRLVEVQRALVDLVNLIDPRGNRVSAGGRTKA